MKIKKIISILFCVSLIGYTSADYIIKINVSDSVKSISKSSNEVWSQPYTENTDWLTQDDFCDFKFNLNIGSILEVDIDIE